MLNINKERLFKDLKTLGHIGWIEGKGLFRESYSESFYDARNFVQQRMEEIGLKTRIDSVGNLFGRLEGYNNNIIMSGSHLDAVPGGGILDGALGVVGALECVRSIKEHNVGLRHSIEVVGFIGEEGGPLGGTFGSRAFSGQITALPPQDVLNAINLTSKDIELARGNLNSYDAFIELHVEQGPILWKKGIPIGIPTVIVGIHRYICNILGLANHAGTTPMEDRKDALHEAILVIYNWLDHMKDVNNIVYNIGYFDVKPGHPSIVPGEVNFIVEMRSYDEDKLEDAVKKLREFVSSIRVCNATLNVMVQKAPVKLSKEVVDIIEMVALDLGLQTHRMVSWASHDAAAIAHIIPTGMIFVPSISGISHQKDEFTSCEDVAKGVSLLANTILKLDNLSLY